MIHHKAIPDAYFPWYGGKYAPTTERVHVIFRSLSMTEGSTGAHDPKTLSWAHRQIPADIIAYKPVRRVATFEVLETVAS